MSCVLTRPSTILGLVVARFIFAPLFMLCHTKHAGPLQLPVFAATDAMPYTFMFVFALSNGWLTTSVFVASQACLTHSSNMSDLLIPPTSPTRPWVLHSVCTDLHVRVSCAGRGRAVEAGPCRVTSRLPPELRNFLGLDAVISGPIPQLHAYG